MCVKEILGVIVIFEFCEVDDKVDFVVVVVGCVFVGSEIKFDCNGCFVVLKKCVILGGLSIIDVSLSVDEYGCL